MESLVVLVDISSYPKRKDSEAPSYNNNNRRVQYVPSNGKVSLKKKISQRAKNRYLESN